MENYFWNLWRKLNHYCSKECDNKTKKVKNGTEQAVLDFFLINEKFRPFSEEILIDKDIEYGVFNTSQMRKDGKLSKSDHNSLIASFNIGINKTKLKRKNV